MDRWGTGVGPGTGARMLWTGLLFFFSPFLSREWFLSLLCTGVPLCSYPSCCRHPPDPGEPCEGWLNHLQRSLRICFTSKSFFPDTDIFSFLAMNKPKRSWKCAETPGSSLPQCTRSCGLETGP
ncbi:hypothetical protein GDO81_024407 [Engystomops pustulosus]|uniref:Secreted protein n=1 Tax=Engystomops pustulosus TaxID=76066 RepID=A0AAV6ZMJ1_ENGPU|nr:hypothetical protein GDO81_024407 [Engystomops pustulosus]